MANDNKEKSALEILRAMIGELDAKAGLIIEHIEDNMEELSLSTNTDIYDICGDLQNDITNFQEELEWI